MSIAPQEEILPNREENHGQERNFRAYQSRLLEFSIFEYSDHNERVDHQALICHEYESKHRIVHEHVLKFCADFLNQIRAVPLDASIQEDTQADK